MQRRLLLATTLSTALAVGWACGDPSSDAPEPASEPEATEAAEPEAPEAPAPEGAEPEAAQPVAVTIGAAPTTDAERAAADRARSGAQRLGGTLKTRLLTEMAQGPAHAVSFCGDNAQSLTNAIAEETGVRVGRSSTQLRNPSNAGPDWVRTWLEAQDGVDPEAVTPSAGIEGEVARFIAPIRVAGPCLACHGPPASIDPEVRAILADGYPADQATGYATGDLRGALWAEAPLAP